MEENESNPAQEEIKTSPATSGEQANDEIAANKLDLPGDDSPTHHPHFKPAKSKRKLPIKKLGISLLALALLAGIAYGAYSFVKKDKEPKAASSQSESAPASVPESTSSSQDLSETYTSSGLRLEFKHPADWKVNEVDRGIRIESPSFSYTAKDQSQVEGNFRIYIRKGARPIDGQFLGNAYALAPSQKLAYSSPVSGQRDTTWLTNFWRGSPDGFNFFVVQGNFELKKGATLGPDFAKEPGAYLIVGGYSKPENEEDLNMAAMPDSSYDQNQQYKTAVAIVQSLQLK